MGVYSQLDLEQKYGDAPFVEDDPFMEDDPFVEDDAPANVENVAATTNEAARAENTSAVQSQVNQAEDAPATEPQVNQVPPAANDAAQSAEDKAAEADAKRKAHEEAEAQRKAEWEAKQAQKKAEEQKKLDELAAMSAEELMAASTRRVGTDTEKLTRRNMMECVAEHIQTMCLTDPAFAMKVMHPRKNMIRCYQYINRKAWEFVQDEMKAMGTKLSRENPYYGSSVPDDVCYQWAVDYFNDPDAKEDHEEEEKFVPNPYRGPSSTPAKKAKGKGKATNKAKVENGSAAKEAKPAAPKPKEKEDDAQFSFDGFAMPEEKAG